MANQDSQIEDLRRFLGTPRFVDDSGGDYYEFTREPFQVLYFSWHGDFALIRLDRP